MGGGLGRTENAVSMGIPSCDSSRGGKEVSETRGVFAGFILGRDGAAVVMRVVVWPVGEGRDGQEQRA